MKLAKKTHKLARSLLYKSRRALEHIRRHKMLTIIAVIWIITGGILYGIAGQRAIDTNIAQNSARASLLAADIHSLPPFTDVQIGQTSGLLPHVKTTRVMMADSIQNGNYRPKSPPFWTILHPSYWTSLSERRLHTKLVDELRANLLDSTKDVDKFGKFVAYSPTIDLANNLDQADTAERLERTQAGFEQVRSALPNSGLEQRRKSLSLLIEILPDITTLTDESLPQWSDKVAQIQQLIVDDMHQRDILSTDYSARLLTVAQSYQ